MPYTETPMTNETTTLEQIRDELGISGRSIALAIGVDPAGFHRIERGQKTPKQDTARKIFEFYGGIVPLGMIYDPAHPEYRGWLSPPRRKQLEKLRRSLAVEYPDLRTSGHGRAARRLTA